MNILRWKRKSNKKIKLKTLILFIFSLVMTTFAWFAYSKVLNTTLNIHMASWDMEYYIGAEKKTNPISIGVPTLYPTMPEHTVTIDIKNNGEKAVDIEYEIQSVTIAGTSYQLFDENATDLPENNYIVLSPPVLETDEATSKKVYRGVITNHISRFPFTVEIEHSAQVLPAGQGYLTVTVNWIGDNNELDSEWGYVVGEYLEANPDATSVMSIVLNIESYQVDPKGETLTTTLPSTAETTPYLPTGFSRVAGTNLDTGLVIKDASGNEYVWVEVPKSASIYTDAGLSITEFTDAEYVLIEDDLKEYTSDYRNGTAFVDEHNEQYVYAAVGLNADNYAIAKKKMLKSIYQNGGFYIGRYETGIADAPKTSGSTSSDPTQTPVIKQHAYPYNYVTNSQAQRLAAGMESGDYSTSLLFGLQWDLTLKYLETKKSATVDELNTDSTNFGNYFNSLWCVTNANAKYCASNTWANGAYGEKGTNNEIILSTGASTAFSKQNIYDLSGNLQEWTLEYTSDSSSPCAVRGGEYSLSSSEASYRNTSGVTYINSNTGFRVTLY